MKLTSAQIQNTLTQIPVQVVPEGHPLVSQLKELFGDHTFFLAIDGLDIVETAEQTDTGGQVAHVVNLASWADEGRTALTAHQPLVTDVVVELGPKDPDTAS